MRIGAGLGISRKHRSYFLGRDYGPGCLLDLDARVENVVTVSGNVSTWKDRSRNGNDYTQGTAGQRPAYLATGWPNGKACLSFTAASAHNLIGPTHSFGAFTMYFVLKGSGANNSGFHTPYGYNNAGATEQSQVYNASTFSMQVQRAGGTSSRDSGANGWIDTNAHILCWAFDGTHAGHIIYVDNVNVSSGWANRTANDPGSGAESWTATRLGGTGGGSNFFDGLMARVLIYNSSHSSSVRAKIHAELKHLYGTS